MVNNILIIGIGNLGKRYIEAVLKLKKINYIYLFDKKKKIRENLKIYFLKKKEVKILDSLHLIKKKIFKICIVSTVSKNRLELIEYLEKKFIIKNYIIEKILEQNSSKIIKIKEALNDKLNYSWVNLPYRSMKFYKIVKKKLYGKPRKILIAANNLDLASNTVHYVYWYSFLLNSKFQKMYVKKKSYFRDSKRKNFKEMFGEIIIYFENGCKLILKSNKNKQALSINHKIYNKRDKIILFFDEISGMIKNRNEIIYKKIEYLSTYMQVIIRNILSKKNCSLPMLSEVYLDHAQIVQNFLQFYNKKNNKNIRNINIT